MTELLSVRAIAGLCNPFESICWQEHLSSPLTRKEVAQAVLTGDVLPPEARIGSRRDHVARIAWFAIHGWSDPISVDVGVPGLPGYRFVWIITDGNHRFAAALCREDETIAGEIGGSLSYAFESGILRPRHRGAAAPVPS